MNARCTDNTAEPLGKFRQQIYESFPLRRDATMNLLDSLCTNAAAGSVVELSLNGSFNRGYSSDHDAIDRFAPDAGNRDRTAEGEKRREARTARARIVAEHIPAPSQKRPFWLFGVDTTPNRRPFAATLPDRGVVYRPNPAPGNKPIFVGHTCSVVAALPELSPLDPPWVVPLDCQRVPTETKATAVAAEQTGALVEDASLPYGEALSVEVADSHYSRAYYLHTTGDFANHVVIARSAGNRVYYRQPADPSDSSSDAGHPTWYGEPFRLADPGTWGAPAETAELQDRTKKGRRLRIRIERWNDLSMRGHRDCPMHSRPFDLFRCIGIAITASSHPTRRCATKSPPCPPVRDFSAHLPVLRCRDEDHCLRHRNTVGPGDP